MLNEYEIICSEMIVYIFHIILIWRYNLTYGNFYRLHSFFRVSKLFKQKVGQVICLGESIIVLQFGIHLSIL